MKKLLSLVLSALMLLCTAISLVGCGGGGDSTISEIYVAISEGGFGRTWIDDCAARFEAAVADKSYADGKTGAKITVRQESDARNTMQTGGYAIVELGGIRRHISDPVGSGLLMNIDDWMKEENPWNEDRESIASYVQENTKNVVQVEGEYYGAPAWEWFGGLCYDVHLFDEYGWYIADPTAGQGHTVTPQYNETPMGSIYLINDADSKKSCGRDGVFGTTDDGLPTTLKEFATLCFLILQEGVDVFTLPGQWLYHGNYFLAGLWGALSNYEELNATSDFQGKITAIKLDDQGDPIPTGNSLFEGVPASLTPELETEEVTVIRNANSPYYTDASSINYQEVGNAIYGSAARYYADSFFYLMKEYGMYVDADSKTTSHTASQSRFVFSKIRPDSTPRRAFLIDGTYWYCEAVEISTFADYEGQTGDTARAQEEIQWFSLPASLDTPVTPNENEIPNEQAIINCGESYWGISSMFEDDAETLALAKDFLQFMVSKKELANHTVYSSNCMSYEYELTEDQYNSLTAFGKSNFDMHKTAKVVNSAPTVDNSVYLQHFNEFNINCHTNQGIYFYPSGNGADNFYKAVETWGLVDTFMKGYFDKATWRALSTFDPNN